MKSYLNDRHQWVRVNNSFSSWEKIITGALQATILRPLLFKIFINTWKNSKVFCELILMKLRDGYMKIT